jgi:RHS repeat-associated protein
MRTIMMRTEFRWIVLLLAIALPRVVAAQAQDEVFYYHLDAIGSVRAITDANGQVVELRDFLPFGEAWPPSGASSDPRQFTGQEHDAATGFDYFGARYYASLNGRFTRADDPGYANPFDPQTLNLYAYVYNNPLRFVDPTGHDGDCPSPYQTWDQNTGGCYVDQGMLQFLLGLGRPLSMAAQSIWNFAIAPRNQGCMGMMTAGGAVTGALTGGGVGIVTGPGEAVLVPVGALTGAVKGAVVGSVVCMTPSGSGGGGGGGGGGNNAGKTVAEILKSKKASIRNAAPDPGSPSWEDILNETWESIEAGARAGRTGFRTIRKLLTDSRFNK